MADEFFSHSHALLLPPPASELSEESLPTLLLIAKLMKVMGRASREGSLQSGLSLDRGSDTTSCLTVSLSSFPKFSLDTLYVSTAKHVFEKNLKPKLLKWAQASSSSLMSKEVDKLMQTLESYLLSIVNPEWAVAIAISLTQEVPEGVQPSALGTLGVR